MSTTYSKSLGNDYTLKLIISESDASVANNTSKISWKVQVSNGSKKVQNSSTKDTYVVKIGGTTVYNSSVAMWFSSQNSTITIASGTKTVTHNDNGSLSLACSVAFTMGYSPTSYSPTSSGTASGTFTCTTIARASTLALGSSSVTITNDNAASTIKATITPKASFYHKLVWKIGSTTITTQTFSASSSTSKTITYSQIANALTSSTSGTLTVTLTTYSSSAMSTQIGSAASKTATVKITATPSFSWSWVSGYGTDKLTPSHQEVKLQIDSTTLAYNAEISKAEWSVSSSNCSITAQSTSGATVKAPYKTSNYTFTITCKITDKRGLTASKTSSVVTCYGYQLPTLSGKAFRCDSSKAESLYSTNCILNLSNLTSYYKGATLTPTATITYTDPETSKSVSVTGTTTGVIDNLSESSSLNFTVVLKDSYGQNTYYFTVSSCNIPLDLYDNGSGTVGVGLGTFATESVVKSNLPIRLSNAKNLQIENTSGDYRSVVGLDASNNYVFGFGGYYNSEGTTYLEGNDVIVRAKNNIIMDSDTDFNNRILSYGSIYLRNSNVTDRQMSFTISSDNWSGLTRQSLDSSGSTSTVSYAILYDDSLRVSPKLYVSGAIENTGAITTAGSIYLSNAHYVRGTNSSGTSYDIIGIGSSNYTYVGSSSVATRLRGKTCVLDSSGATITSDERLKYDIDAVSDDYLSFYDKLNPVSYKFKTGNSGRTHIGLIAQEVEQALKESNLDNTKFGGIHIDDVNAVSDEEYDEHNSNDYAYKQGYTDVYGLAYEEFIALNMAKIKQLEKTIHELENRVKELENG